MIFTGEELDQKDCDVFMALLNLVQEQGSYTPICSLYALRKMLSRAKGKRNSEAIKMSIDRLHAASIKMSSQNVEYAGHLINNFAFDRKKGTYVVELDQRMAHLFNDGYARFNIETRVQLKGDLTKFLHGLVLTHEAKTARPQTYKLETIHSLSRSKEKNRRNFKIKVRTAMKQLKENNVIIDWCISVGNLLKFTRSR